MQELDKRSFLKLLGGIVAFLGTGFPRRVFSSNPDAGKMLSADMEAQLTHLENEVRQVRDIQEIKRLHYRYATGVFFQKWENVTECFAETCRLEDGEIVGREEAGNRLKAAGTGENLHRQGGLAVHPRIDVDGSKAKGRWLLYKLIPYQLTGQLMFYRQELFDVEYIRGNNGWKIYSIKSSQRLGPEQKQKRGESLDAVAYPGT